MACVQNCHQSEAKKKSVSNYCKPLVHMSFDIVIIRDVVMLILKKKVDFDYLENNTLNIKPYYKAEKKND